MKKQCAFKTVLNLRNVFVTWDDKSSSLFLHLYEGKAIHFALLNSMFEQFLDDTHHTEQHA